MFSSKLLLVVLMSTAIGGRAETLTIASWGGEYSEAQRRAFFEPFTAESGHRIVEDSWGGDIARIRAMVEKNHYTATVFDAEEDQVHEGCDQGILEEIDYPRLGIERAVLLPGAAHRCGVGSIAWSMVFAYDPSQLGDRVPRNWEDFWNVTKFPGKRGLYRGAETTLEIALLADGVSAEKIYTELATVEGRARAFRKLDSLRPHVVWWRAGAQAPQLLIDREVVMTSGWNGRLHRASTSQRPFPIVWRGQLLFFEYWVIPKGHPNVRLAYEFIRSASSPERQAQMSHYLPYGPLHTDWTKFAPASKQNNLPTSPENLREAVKTQPGYWAQHAEESEQAFSEWLTRAPHQPTLSR